MHSHVHCSIILKSQDMETKCLSMDDGENGILYIYIYIYIYTYTHTYMYVYVYVYICTHTCTHIHTIKIRTFCHFPFFKFYF